MNMTARQRAMAERCSRYRNGDCPCAAQCEVEKGLLEQRQTLEAQVAGINRELNWLRHKPCTVRPDWKRPEKPYGDYELAVLIEGGECHPHWFSWTEPIDSIDIIGPDAWPFVEETAWPDDWAKLGFEVV